MWEDSGLKKNQYESVPVGGSTHIPEKELEDSVEAQAQRELEYFAVGVKDECMDRLRVRLEASG